MILVARGLAAELRADLRQQLRADHHHVLLRDAHALGRLAEIGVVRDRLGDERVERGSLNDLSQSSADCARAGSACHAGGMRVSFGSACSKDLRLRRRRLERAAGERRGN